MFKIKNTKSEKNFFFKNSSNEPDEFVDVNLQEIITCPKHSGNNEDSLNKKSITKCGTKFLFSVGIGFLAVLCILLTMLLINDLKPTSDYNDELTSTSHDHHSSELLTSVITETDLIRLNSIQEHMMESSKYHYRYKREEDKSMQTSIRNEIKSESFSEEIGSAENSNVLEDDEDEYPSSTELNPPSVKSDNILFLPAFPLFDSVKEKSFTTKSHTTAVTKENKDSTLDSNDISHSTVSNEGSSTTRYYLYEETPTMIQSSSNSQNEEYLDSNGLTNSDVRSSITTIKSIETTSITENQFSNGHNERNLASENNTDKFLSQNKDFYDLNPNKKETDTYTTENYGDTTLQHQNEKLSKIANIKDEQDRSEHEVVLNQKSKLFDKETDEFNSSEELVSSTTKELFGDEETVFNEKRNSVEPSSTLESTTVRSTSNTLQDALFYSENDERSLSTNTTESLVEDVLLHSTVIQEITERLDFAPFDTITETVTVGYTLESLNLLGNIEGEKEYTNSNSFTTNTPIEVVSNTFNLNTENSKPEEDIVKQISLIENEKLRERFDSTDPTGTTDISENTIDFEQVSVASQSEDITNETEKAITWSYKSTEEDSEELTQNNGHSLLDELENYPQTSTTDEITSKSPVGDEETVSTTHNLLDQFYSAPNTVQSNFEEATTTDDKINSISNNNHEYTNTKEYPYTHYKETSDTVTEGAELEASSQYQVSTTGIDHSFSSTTPNSFNEEITSEKIFSTTTANVITNEKYNIWHDNSIEEDVKEYVKENSDALVLTDNYFYSKNVDSTSKATFSATDSEATQSNYSTEESEFATNETILSAATTEDAITTGRYDTGHDNSIEEDSGEYLKEKSDTLALNVTVNDSLYSKNVHTTRETVPSDYISTEGNEFVTSTEYYKYLPDEDQTNLEVSVLQEGNAQEDVSSTNFPTSEYTDIITSTLLTVSRSTDFISTQHYFHHNTLTNHWNENVGKENTQTEMETTSATSVTDINPESSTYQDITEKENNNEELRDVKENEKNLQPSTFSSAEDGNEIWYDSSAEQSDKHHFKELPDSLVMDTYTVSPILHRFTVASSSNNYHDLTTINSRIMSEKEANNLEESTHSDKQFERHIEQSDEFFKNSAITSTSEATSTERNSKLLPNNSYLLEDTNTYDQIDELPISSTRSSGLTMYYKEDIKQMKQNETTTTEIWKDLTQFVQHSTEFNRNENSYAHEDFIENSTESKDLESQTTNFEGSDETSNTEITSTASYDVSSKYTPERLSTNTKDCYSCDSINDITSPSTVHDDQANTEFNNKDTSQIPYVNEYFSSLDVNSDSNTIISNIKETNFDIFEDTTYVLDVSNEMLHNLNNNSIEINKYDISKQLDGTNSSKENSTTEEPLDNDYTIASTTNIFSIANRNIRSSEYANNTNSTTSSRNNLQQKQEPGEELFKNDTSIIDDNSYSEFHENSSTTVKEFATVKLRHTVINKNSKTTCPTFLSPMGVPILQQANTSPYLYNSNQLSSYISGVPFPVQRNSFNPYNPSVQNSPKTTLNNQYYMCYPVPNSSGNIDEIPEAELLGRSLKINSLEHTLRLETPQNKTREARDCPIGEQSCEDGSRCIKSHHVCDGDVQCKDASDEAFCSCRLRISNSRLCDGYFDCPNGEDEINCFGCDEDMFHCDDWLPKQRVATCIPLTQRCDGISQCPTGKDEEDCTVLKVAGAEKQNFLVSATRGFLYRNYRGRWYPACENPEFWASEVCRVESGPSTIAPLTHLVPIKIDYDGPYINALSEQDVKVVDSCEGGAAVFVECPPLVCGLRVKLRNPYRREEVDTSAEQVLMPSEQSQESLKNVTQDEVVGDGRIVGGKPSQPEAWPWVVSVYRNGVFHCGGVLINEFWVVTAAHCIDKYWHYYFEIQAGVLRRYSFSPMVQNRVVSHVVSHQLYDRAKLKNDLALMKLAKPMRFNRYVRPICLPSEITAGKNYLWGPEPKTICTVVGWGATVEHGSDPDHLREVEVYVFKRCKHHEDEEGREICAGLKEGGKDACQGDSGGPFMCRNPNVPNQWYLAGVVSHGEGCARPNEPGVYTRVSLFLEWIFENIRGEVLPQTRPLRRCPGYVCRITNRCIPNKRRCDKVVDCLLGDDEEKCDRHSLNEIFKNTMRRMLLLGTTHDESLENNTLSSDGIANSPNLTLTTNNNPNFLCTKILQTISISKKCNRIADCEDATDEEDCLCTDYLRSMYPQRICDGIVDCWDSSDENSCSVCKSNEFNCRQSNVCISKEKRCDGMQDCPLEEDEQNCFALTNGKSIFLDADSTPHLNDAGLVSFDDREYWRFVCMDWNGTEATIATDVCYALGFSSYESFRKVILYDDTLQVVQEPSRVLQKGSNSTKKCTGLHIKCSKSIDIKPPKQQENMFNVPWNAEIFVNGKYRCMGSIVEETWIIAPRTCFTDFNQYVTVLLGTRRSAFNVVGPHEQIIRVTGYLVLPNTNIVLLRLDNNVQFSRYIRSLYFDVRDLHLNKNDKCVVTGKNSNNVNKIIYLQSQIDCAVGSRCFKLLAPVHNCSQDTNIWDGTVVCHSKTGWYPAAIFHGAMPFCNDSDVAFTNIQFWKADILDLIKETSVSTIRVPPCKGVRCNLGNCLDSKTVCDGIVDCHEGTDEQPDICNNLKRNSKNRSELACLKSEIRCRNGKCIPKSAFCDTVNDCEDWSDEPDRCTCSSYLSLTNPERNCDGIPHCLDKTDENPNICNCTENHFKCQETQYCVPQHFVCDGVDDCPNGQDEKYCFALEVASDGTPPEVHVRTAGVWHPGCFPKSLTTLQLEEICAKIGYTTGSAKKIEYEADLNNSTVTRPVVDPFSIIRIHKRKGKLLLLAIRSDDRPFVTFKSDPNCHRLYLECLGS